VNKLNLYLDKIIAASNEPDEKGCWNWQGAKTTPSPRNLHAGGYGAFQIAGKKRYAHALSFLVFKVLSDPPNAVSAKPPLSQYTDAEVLALLDASSVKGTDHSHLCHNRGCVNPEHVVRESHSKNMQRRWDKQVSKLKYVITKKYRCRCKLKPSQVEEIAKRVADGEAQYKLAKEYKVSQSTVSKIRYGKYKTQTEAQVSSGPPA
jgi:hypothetical protein